MLVKENPFLLNEKSNTVAVQYPYVNVLACLSAGGERGADAGDYMQPGDNGHEDGAECQQVCASGVESFTGDPLIGVMTN
jgi:hypothetical protein